MFVDKSGNPGDDAKYYLLALVLHDQSEDVFEHIGRYEDTLAQRGLRNIPAKDAARYGGCDLRNAAAPPQSYARRSIGIAFEPFVRFYAAQLSFHSLFSFKG